VQPAMHFFRSLFSPAISANKFVSGHGFSRAIKANKRCGLQPPQPVYGTVSVSVVLCDNVPEVAVTVMV